jgi:hypothetical protein
MSICNSGRTKRVKVLLDAARFPILMLARTNGVSTRAISQSPLAIPYLKSSSTELSRCRRQLISEHNIRWSAFRILSHFGIPLAARKYAVEKEITIFETDVPAQRLWMRAGSKDCSVL